MKLVEKEISWKFRLDYIIIKDQKDVYTLHLTFHTSV